MSPSTIVQILFNSLRLGSIVALATLGIVLIYRTSKATNFAQGSIGTFNAYIAAYLMINYGWSVWMSLLVALVTAFLTGVVIDKLFIRPAAKANVVSKQILTLGIILVLLGIMNLNFWFFSDIWPSTMSRTPDPFISSAHTLSILGTSIEWNTVFIFLLTAALMGMFFFVIRKTRWGLATRVTASNEPVARLMGVPTKTVTLFSWAVAAMLGALAAVALSANRLMDPNMMIGVQVGAFFAAVFGGFSTFYGPVIAAYIIGFSLHIGRHTVVNVFDGSRFIAELIVYMLILVILYFKPFGIFGKPPEEKV